MKLEYTVSREHRARAEARANPPDNGESENDRALRRMVGPMPFWFDYDGISEEMFLGTDGRV